MSAEALTSDSPKGYSAWIQTWLSKNDPYGKCMEAAESMAEAFDDLEVVKGHVHCDWGKRGHWWCADSDGNIFDPTMSQFGAVFEYEPWISGSEVRVGKCMNCGNEIWESVQELSEIVTKSICSDKCEVDFEAYLQEEMGD